MMSLRQVLLILSCATAIVGGEQAVSFGQSADSKAPVSKAVPASGSKHEKLAPTHGGAGENGILSARTEHGQVKVQPATGPRQSDLIRQASPDAGKETPHTFVRGIDGTRKSQAFHPVSQLPTGTRRSVGAAAIGGSHAARTTTAAVDGAAMRRKP